MIYSQQTSGSKCCLPACLTATYCGKQETIDLSMIADVSVEQSCWDFFRGTGTVVLHSLPAQESLDK